MGTRCSTASGGTGSLLAELVVGGGGADGGTTGTRRGVPAVTGDPTKRGMPRPLGETERAVLHYLLDQCFPGSEQLRTQLPGLEARPWGGGDPTVDLLPIAGVRAVVKYRVPVEAQFPDRGGNLTHVLVHVVDGWLAELEVYADHPDGPSGQFPLERLEVFLPDAPVGRRWWDQ